MPLDFDSHTSVVEPAEPLLRRRPLLHPTRWPIVAGTVLIAVGAFLPWQVVTYPTHGAIRTNGLDNQDAPGAQLIVFAAVTLALAALPALARSRLRIVQLLPAIFGTASLILGLEEYQSYGIVRMHSIGQSSNVGLESGLWGSIAGTMLVAVGGTLTSAVVASDRPSSRQPREAGRNLSIARPLVSAFAGFCLAVAAAVALVPPDQPLSALMSLGLMVVAAPTLAYLVYGLLGVLSEHWRNPRHVDTRRPDHTRYMRKSDPADQGR